MSMFYINDTGDNTDDTQTGEDVPMSQSQLMLTQFWPKVTEEIKKINVLDLKQQILPLARIKKIMKLDEDVKMISAEAPLLFAKAAEIFILELTLRAWIHTEDNKRRTLQKSDISMAITKYDQFDFLIDIVPRDEVRVNTKCSTSSDSTVKAEMNPDQVQYYFQLAQQHQQALQQTSTTNVAQATTAGPTLQLVQPQLQTVTLANMPSTVEQANAAELTNQSAASTGNLGNFQIVQQVVTANGEIQNIPIQLSQQQLQMIRMQLQPTAAQQPIIIQQTAQPTAQLIQVSPSTATSGQPIFLTQATTSSTSDTD